MASTTTPLIGLFKATPGTNEPFRTADINNNWDILDSFIVNYEARFEELESGADAAVTATNSALATFEVESAEAIAALDTDAIVTAIAAEGVVLDINGGTA
jgi:hypothetical protein